ncbi:MAG: PspC domain-containing protein [Bacteroidota bacterium]|nr:PspC domain-containing protein [Bacteroidota bacterium]MDP4274017.1 PspC domain-containing protein [Bacteroidota bacterium]
MKKTIKINLGGMAFTIDEDAYDKLKTYLAQIGDYFENESEKKEIIDDVEARIAELFSVRLKEQKEVICLDDVSEAIKIMGEPEDFREDKETSGEPAKQKTGGKTTTNNYYSKRFYRDPDNAVLGGVCGGLGAYMNIDPVIIRVLFVILFFGFGVMGIVYLVLWLVVPKALTTAQKLEMRGKEINVSNIRNEYNDAVNNVKKTVRSDGFNDMVHVMGKIIRTCLKIFALFMGIIFILVGVALLFFFTFLPFHHDLFWGSLNNVEVSFPQLVNLFVSSGNVTLVIICLIIALTVPLVALIYAGSKIIFHFKANDKNIGITALVLWFISILTLIALFFTEARNYAQYETVTQTCPLKANPANTLYLQVNESKPQTLNIDSWFYHGHSRILVTDHADKIYGEPTFTIEKSDDGQIKLLIKKEAHGMDRNIAAQNAQKIIYSWEQKDSLLLMDDHFNLPVNAKWTFPNISITLEIPENYKVFINPNMSEILHDIKNVSGTWDENMVGKKWVMKTDGLEEVNP